jgi:GntR family transcriptional regulator
MLAQLHRLRFADEEPLSIERANLVNKLCPGVLENDYEKNSLRKALSKQHGIQLVRAKQSIRAQNATAEQARLLTISPNEALLVVDRVSYSQNNVPVEYLQIVYNAKRYVMYTELQG